MATELASLACCVGVIDASTLCAGSQLAPDLLIGGPHDWSVRIKNTGAVEINPAVTLDEASLAFWRSVERMGFARRGAA